MNYILPVYKMSPIILIIIFLVLGAIFVLFNGANEYLLFLISGALLLILFWKYNINYKCQFIIILLGVFFAFSEYVAVAYLNIWTYSPDKSHGVVPLWLITAWGLFCVFSWILINWCNGHFSNTK
jgi:hypothetical protein